MQKSSATIKRHTTPQRRRVVRQATLDDMAAQYVRMRLMRLDDLPALAWNVRICRIAGVASSYIYAPNCMSQEGRADR